MRSRNPSVLMLSALLLLAAGSALAHGSQPVGPSEVVGANAGLAASAPWVNVEVDTPGDTGQHASVAIDPSNDRIYVSYYDATNQELRVARSWGPDLGNCGLDDSWLCQTVDTAGDVGKYSSIAIWEDKVMVAYYDATNRSLKLAISDDVFYHWV